MHVCDSIHRGRHDCQLTIPTTAPFVFYLVAHGSLGYGCENAGTFQPMPGHHYRLRYLIDTGPLVCVVQIRDLVSGPAGSIRSVPDPTAHFFYPPGRNAGYCQSSISRTRR